jgi:hypothetical protein
MKRSVIGRHQPIVLLRRRAAYSLWNSQLASALASISGSTSAYPFVAFEHCPVVEEANGHHP